MPLPKRVTVELTNRCNRSCDGCPRRKTKYPQGDMTTKLFTEVIGQLPNETVLVPFFRGESLIHPHFASLMNLLSRFKEVQLASNADYLGPKNQTAILTGCTFFSVSLHNLLMPWHVEATKFMHIAQDHGLETQVSILEGLVSEKRKKQFVREWRKHVDRVRIYREHSVVGFGDMDSTDKPTSPCRKPFQEMTVYWDGKVGLCNHDWDNQTELGNLNNDSVEAVWENGNYSLVRRYHEMGKRVNVHSCADCCFDNKLYGELYSANSEQQTA